MSVAHQQLARVVVRIEVLLLQTDAVQQGAAGCALGKFLYGWCGIGGRA